MGLCDAYMGTSPDTPLMGDTTIRVSEELADELYQRKGRSTSYEEFLWELLEEVDQYEERLEGEDIAESDSSSNATTDPAPADVQLEEGEEKNTVEDAEDVLRGLDLPGSGSKYEARLNTVLTFYHYLREHPGERVDRSELEKVADDRGLEHRYDSFGSFWGNWIKQNSSQGRDFNTLAQLPGVEMDGDDYVYTGESA